MQLCILSSPGRAQWPHELPFALTVTGTTIQSSPPAPVTLGASGEEVRGELCMRCLRAYLTGSLCSSPPHASSAHASSAHASPCQSLPLHSLSFSSTSARSAVVGSRVGKKVGDLRGRVSDVWAQSVYRKISETPHHGGVETDVDVTRRFNRRRKAWVKRWSQGGNFGGALEQTCQLLTF